MTGKQALPSVAVSLWKMIRPEQYSGRAKESSRRATESRRIAEEQQRVAEEQW
jgi:hypothetical protein